MQKYICIKKIVLFFTILFQLLTIFYCVQNEAVGVVSYRTYLAVDADGKQCEEEKDGPNGGKGKL